MHLKCDCRNLLDGRESGTIHCSRGNIRVCQIVYVLSSTNLLPAAQISAPESGRTSTCVCLARGYMHCILIVGAGVIDPFFRFNNVTSGIAVFTTISWGVAISGHLSAKFSVYILI